MPKFQDNFPSSKRILPKIYVTLISILRIIVNMYTLLYYISYILYIILYYLIEIIDTSSQFFSNQVYFLP